MRNLKDRMSRQILDRFEEAGVSIASATYDIVGLPPIRLEGPVAERMADALHERAGARR